jgi:ribosome-associated protein
MDSRTLALRCRELADDKKAEKLLILDVRKLSSVTDYFVIATGTSEPHVRAIVGEISDKLREELGLRPRATDGELTTQWVVLDYFDVIVHVMRAETREHYGLESLWGDAKRVRPRRGPTSQRRTAARPG